MDRPAVVVFDVNETLSDLRPLGEELASAGVDPGLAATWFAAVLRDGFALTAVGGTARFADIGRSLLRAHLSPAPDVADVDGVVERVMATFSRLDVHDDVPDGVRALAEAGFRLVTLSNGSADIAEGLLARAGVRDRFEHVLSVEPSGPWKPAAAAYAKAERATGVPLARMVLVAVHPWDLDGAHRAGMLAAWLDRRGGSPYPDHFSAPDVVASGVGDLAARLD